MALSPEHRERILALLAEGREAELTSDDRLALFPPERQECELVYEGKERREDVLAETMAVPFQKVRTFGTPAPIEGGESDGWENQLIFGDNLQAMRYLLDLKRDGRLKNADGTDGVKLIYIDPPFATRQEFRGNQDQKAYADKIAGAQFIEFLRRRLIMMRELMADDGQIYVHINWRKGAYVKLVMDEIFGEANFANEIIWRATDPHNDVKKKFGTVHQNIYFYKMRDDVLNFSEVRENLSETALKEYSLMKLPSGEIVDYDPHLEGRRLKLNDATWKGTDKTKKFVWRGASPSGPRVWPRDPEGMEQGLRDGDFYLRNPERGAARCKVDFLDTNPGQVPQDIWENCGSMKGGGGYPTEKPEELLARIIRVSSKPGDIVLDAFMGSGTTISVAEKLGRRWIGIDVGKLAIYTTQKRLLNLRTEVGNKGSAIEPRPFTLFNAGLYDFKSLKELSRPAWRFFALQLFGCRNRSHKKGGVQLDGTRGGDPVLVFDHHANPKSRVDRQTIEALHAKLGDQIGSRLYIIGPRGVFDFQEDYLRVENTRYYALRIPYSFIEELHRRGFSTLRQPEGEKAVNELVDSVGFDFIEPPSVKYNLSIEAPEGQIFEQVTLETLSFESRWRSKGQILTGGLETLSMIMLDFDYDSERGVFDLDKVFYADGLAKDNNKAQWRPEQTGAVVAAIWVDIHGNESFRTFTREEWGLPPLSEEEKTAHHARKAASVTVESETASPAQDEDENIDEAVVEVDVVEAATPVAVKAIPKAAKASSKPRSRKKAASSDR